MAGNNAYSYKVLFETGFRNSYFNDNQCKVLNFELTPASKKLFDNLSLIIKKTAAGFLILYNKKFPERISNYIAANGKWTSLTFRVKTESAYFNNYTDLPADMVNKSLYLNNLEAHRNIDDKGVIILHPGEFEKGAQALPVQGAQVILSLPSNGDDFLIEVFNISGDIIVSKTVFKTELVSQVTIDMSSFPEGRYMATISELKPQKIVKEYTWLYINGQKPYVGFLEFFLTAPENSNRALFPLKGQTITQPKYQVNFKYRAPYCNYIIVFDGQVNYNSLIIKSLSGEFGFLGPRQVNVGEGKLGYLFTSLSEIPLKELSPYKFRLIEDKGFMNEITIINQLPAARLDRLRIDEEQSTTTTYVTV